MIMKVRSTSILKCTYLTFIGVLQRYESLAANLGAKLTGPLVLKSFEKLFDGPIKVIQDSYALAQSPITWLDIVTLARSNPSEFVLTDSEHGIRTCRVYIRGGQVEICEEDYRLIRSGAPERVIPSQPIAEDESAEVGTLNILETRLSTLIKRADAVAGKARQLNYHLKSRKSAILARKAVDNPAAEGAQARNFSPQPFSAINARSPNPVSHEVAKLQQDLLEQFTSSNRHNSPGHQQRPKASRTSADTFHSINSGPQDFDRRLSHSLGSSDDSIEGQYRLRMAAKIEKLSRGDPITPPCDRCRRLGFDCTKHLTACSACTKKHAKCSWKDIKESELQFVPPFGSASTPPQLQGGKLSNGYNSPGSGGRDSRPSFDLTQEDRGPATGVGDPGLEQSQNRTDGQGIDNQALAQRKADLIANETAILTQIASAASSSGSR